MDEPKPEPLPLDTRNVVPIGVTEPAPAAGNGAMGGNRSTVESAPVRPRARPRYRARTWERR